VVDLVSGMAAAQIADVFVGTHGANLANGWLMRPGASMIEVQPYGFDAHVPHLQDPLFNAQVPPTASSALLTSRIQTSTLLVWLPMWCRTTRHR
jgi:hypothetical protein